MNATFDTIKPDVRNLATKTDLAELRVELRTEIANFRIERAEAKTRMLKRGLIVVLSVQYLLTAVLLVRAFVP